jgi:hypothetical protein
LTDSGLREINRCFFGDLLLAAALTFAAFFLADAFASATWIVQQIGIAIDPVAATMATANGSGSTARSTSIKHHSASFQNRAI